MTNTMEGKASRHGAISEARLREGAKVAAVKRAAPRFGVKCAARPCAVRKMRRFSPPE